MAHFARIDADGIVREVTVIRNEDILDKKGKESEAVGQAFIASIGLDGTWLQTSYNGSFRGRFAGVGMKYDETLDEFIVPEPETPTE